MRSPISRRGFLRLGLLSGAVIAGGAWVMRRSDARYARLVPPDYRRAVLSEKELAVLLALCDRVIAPTPGAPTARQARIAERIDRELSFHQGKLQRDIEAALFVVEHGGVVHGSLARFTTLPPEEQDARLAAMATGRAVERQVFSNLRLVSLYFYYCDERTWPGIHYDGPKVTIPAPPEADSRVAPRSMNG